MNTQSTVLDLRVAFRPLVAFASFEAVFVLFLISVNYQSHPAISWFPIGLTVFFFAVGVAMGLVIICREGIYLPGLTVVSLLILFISWVLLTTLWTPSEIYAREKLIKLATLNLWSIIATAMIIANRRERVQRFLLLVLVLGTAASLDGILRYSGIYDTAPEASSAVQALSGSFRFENYLVQSRFYGMGALVAFAAWLYTSPFSKRGVGLMGAFAICFYGLLITGGRGPMLSTVAGMLLPMMLGLRFADRRILASRALLASCALLAMLVGAILYGIAEYSHNLRTLQRLTILWTEEEGGQGRLRLEFWRASWDLWLAQPLFGGGIGSWPVRSFGLDVPRYPHNLILEVLVEFGVVGLLLLAAVGVVAVRRTSVRRLREDLLLMCAAMLGISTFLYAMTSSDITGNRNLFAMLGLLVMRPYRRTSRALSERRAGEFGPSGQRNSDLLQGVPSPGGRRA